MFLFFHCAINASTTLVIVDAFLAQRLITIMYIVTITM